MCAPLPAYLPPEWHDRITVMVDAKGTHYLWTGWNNGQGHAKARRNGKAVYVHRWVVETVSGKKLGRFDYVDHVCEHKPCINFDCLEPVTPGENTARGPGRQHQYRRADAYS